VSFCLASAALIAGGIATTGSLTALVLKKAATSKIASNNPTIFPSKEDRNG